jgi:hypothetical protein
VQSAVIVVAAYVTLATSGLKRATVPTGRSRRADPSYVRMITSLGGQAGTAVSPPWARYRLPAPRLLGLLAMMFAAGVSLAGLVDIFDVSFSCTTRSRGERRCRAHCGVRRRPGRAPVAQGPAHSATRPRRPFPSRRRDLGHRDWARRRRRPIRQVSGRSMRSRGFNHRFASALPFGLACAHSGVWQYRPAATSSGLLPPSARDPAPRLPPASPGRCVSPGPASQPARMRVAHIPPLLSHGASWRTIDSHGLVDSSLRLRLPRTPSRVSVSVSSIPSRSEPAAPGYVRSSSAASWRS